MGSVLIEVTKHTGGGQCEHRDPKYGYCDHVAKYILNGVFVCNTHVGTKVKQLVNEASER